MANPVIRLTGIKNQFGPQVVHEDLDLEVYQGEVLGVVGGSGTGKSVLMRTIIGLNPPTAGRVEILGQDVSQLSASAWQSLQSRWGVLFQDGALFSSLTVRENIQLPLREKFDFDPTFEDELAGLKLALVGLQPSAADKYPSELSGGMRKRAGLARALALDPEIIFLDEPTAGLDPIGAADFDALILTLQESLGLTVMMITHDVDSLVRITDRIAVLLDRRCVTAPLDELRRREEPWIRDYFHGVRGRAALAGKTENAGEADNQGDA
ncbi:MAG: ABC transporter ATP-binding protein [Geminicoccaceae bacterium]